MSVDGLIHEFSGKIGKLKQYFRMKLQHDRHNLDLPFLEASEIYTATASDRPQDSQFHADLYEQVHHLHSEHRCTGN